MKVGIVSTYLPQKCGIATYTSYLINELLNHIKIKIIAEKGAHIYKDDRLEVVPCWDRNTNYVPSIIKEAKDLDIIHIQHEYGIYGFDDRLSQLLKTLNIPKIITIHCIRPKEFSLYNGIEEEFTEKISSLADKIITHMEAQKEILIRLNIPEEKIKIIPHGTKIISINKTEAREKLNLPQNGKILLMFGFIKPHKNIHIAIQAIHKILKEIKNIYLLIAGEERIKNKRYIELIKEDIKKYKLERNIIFFNEHIPEEDVPYIFASADAVILPYYEEDRSASGVLHLAIGANKPVIASRIPKFEELKNIYDGLLISPHNIDGIVKTIIRLLTDGKFYEYIIKRTTQYREKTSWCEVAKLHLNLYKNLL